MVRLFPATTRQRVLAAAIAFAVASAPAATPIAHADDLKHKKHKVEQRVKAARADLDESSRPRRKAHSALQPPGPQLHQARATLAVTRGKLAAAQALDEQMQHELVQAEVALSQARDDLRAGREKVKVQQRLLAEMAAESYAAGRPAADRALGDAQRAEPRRPHHADEDGRNLVDRETTPSTSSRPRARCSRSRRARSRTRRCRSSRSARPPPRTSCSAQRLETKAAEAEDAVTALVHARRSRARTPRARAEHADELHPAEDQARGAADLADAGRAARTTGRQPRATDGLLMRPVPGYVTSPFG